MASQEFDRTVLLPALLRAIDINKPFDPAFGELVPREWLLSEYSGPELNNSATSNDPELEQLPSHDWFPSESKEVVHKAKGNDFQPPSSKKPRPSLSLKKSSSNCFSKPVTSPQRRGAAKRVVSTNTKLNNEWAMRNLNAWIKIGTKLLLTILFLLTFCLVVTLVSYASGCAVSFKKQKRMTFPTLLQHCSCTVSTVSDNNNLKSCLAIP